MSSACNICKQHKKTSVSVIWCPECEKSFCSTCTEHHRSAKSSKDHSPISYDVYANLLPFILNVRLFCPKHEERYQRFCEDHDEPICNRCLATTHKKCLKTSLLTDVVKRVKTTTKFEDAKSELIKTSSSLSVAIKGTDGNLQSLQGLRRSLLITVDKKIEALTDHLKKLKQNTFDDIKDIFEKNECQISRSRQILKKHEECVLDIIGQSDSIKKSFSDFQILMVIKEIGKIRNEANAKLEELSALNDIGITMEEDKHVEDLLSVTNLFHNLKVTTDPKTISEDTAKMNQAQMKFKKEVKKNLHLEQKIKLRVSRYSGCSILPNGQIMLTDFDHGDAKLLDREGSVVHAIKVSVFGDIFDSEVLDYDRVAVTNPASKTISIVNVSASKVVKVLKTNYETRGLTLKDSTLIFCAVKEGLMGIDITSGKVDLIFKDETVTWDSYVVAYNTRVCYTCTNVFAVNVLNWNYELLFKFTDVDLTRYPAGVAIDSHMNIYLACCQSTGLVVVSPDGNACKKLVTDSEDPVEPYDIVYDKNTNQLIVIDLNGFLRKYSILQREYFNNNLF